MFLVHRSIVFADEKNSFVTIVNPVRISTYTKDPLESLSAEYSVVMAHKFPATWLLTDDVLARDNLMNYVSKMDSSQEIGVFLEVTPQLASKSGVSYNKTNGWYRSTSLFLSGYSQSDRIKLIDKIFYDFQARYGYYPKSVGAWWVDSYSLSYMKQKYDIESVLGVSDQYDLDGYQIWGTPWSVPYYPNTINTAIPASSTENKIDVVNFRWAPRDPLNGYASPNGQKASLYSLQDYSTIHLPISYFVNLLETYAFKSNLNNFGQATIGLEADYSPDTYITEFSNRLDALKKLEETGIEVTNMQEFSDWYRRSFPVLSDPYAIESDDLLGQHTRTIWYQNSSYRIGLTYNTDTQESKIFDFRVYPDNFGEPFYLAPNKQYNLSINLPFVIDSVIDPSSEFVFNAGHLKSISKKDESIYVAYDNASLDFEPGNIKSTGIHFPASVISSHQLSSMSNGNGTILTPKVKYFVGPEGLIYTDLSFHVPYALRTKLEKYKYFAIFGIAILASILMLILLKVKISKINLIVLILILCLLFGGFEVVQFSTKYLISQTEMDALSVLSRLPQGRVLVYDKDCINCTFATQYKPAAAAGKVGYIKKYGSQNMVVNLNFETAATSQKAREILKELNVKYVYLAKYESFIESLPYLPEDLGLTRVYQNGNSEIWRVIN